MSRQTLTPLAAEFLGTFMLVFAGCGAIVIDDVTGGSLGHLGIALTFGLVVMTVIYSYGELSGAHINPAVTLGFCALGRFPRRRVMPYIASQCAGAWAAGALLGALFPGHASLGATLPHGRPWVSLVLEAVMTWWLMTVILHMALGGKAKKPFAGLVIGAVVALEAAFGGPISGASMNPARSLGPALVSGAWSHHWIYWAGTIGGALLAVVLHLGPSAAEHDARQHLIGAIPADQVD